MQVCIWGLIKVASREDASPEPHPASRARVGGEERQAGCLLCLGMNLSY